MTGQLLSFPAEPFKARSSGGQLYGIGLGAADQAIEGDGYASCYGQHEQIHIKRRHYRTISSSGPQKAAPAEQDIVLHVNRKGKDRRV